MTKAQREIARLTAESRAAAAGSFRPMRARHAPGVMNKTEARYAETVLEPYRKVGSISGWMFERITLKLADDCRYTPDFLVQRPDGWVEFHEVKGHWEDDARVKIKVAATEFPLFAWVAVTLEDGIWRYETIKSA